MFRSSFAAGLQRAIGERTARVGVIGLGYVGLPLAVAASHAGYRTLGFDANLGKIIGINAGKSHVEAVPGHTLEALVRKGLLAGTDDVTQIAMCDIVIICVPTPLTVLDVPDLSHVCDAVQLISNYLRAGQLVVLGSTTYPGTTREIVKPILEQPGLVSGEDFFLSYSPEREDPGNTQFPTTSIPKVVSGDGLSALILSKEFFQTVFEHVVTVSSLEVAEAAKLTENVFRSVNIALVNELKIAFRAMGIDIWEVIEAAATKPFGFLPFYPGPGLGGHCIPIDSHYLTWRARNFNVTAQLVDTAVRVNSSMPKFVVDVLSDSLLERFDMSINSAHVLIVGVAYKKNISDIRESPGLRVLELLRQQGARACYHDPLVDRVTAVDSSATIKDICSVELSHEILESVDAVLILTDHDVVDYERIAKESKLVIDTRNIMARRGILGSNIVKA